MIRSALEIVISFRKVIGRAHHILPNYFDQMQLVTMEAKRCGAFDKEMINLSKDISEEAAAGLVKLNEIESLTADRSERARLQFTLRRP